jgi:hypothetical protein
MTVISYTIALAFILLLIPVTWTQFLWIRYKDLQDESENSTEKIPQNGILNFFYQTSVKVYLFLINIGNFSKNFKYPIKIQVIWNEIFRIILYFLITAMTAMTTVFNFLVKINKI